MGLVLAQLTKDIPALQFKASKRSDSRRASLNEISNTHLERLTPPSKVAQPATTSVFEDISDFDIDWTKLGALL
jgi:hypothetical protein